MSRELRYVKELPALTEEQKGLFRKLGIEPTWWWVEGAKTGIGFGEFFYGFSPPAASAGETIYCTLIVVAKNFIPLGDPLRGYFGIKYNGTEIARVEQEFYGLTSAITAGSFKMPDKDVTVTFFGGHEKEETTFWGTHRGTGEWVEDFSIKVTLKRPLPPVPKPPPKKYPPVAAIQLYGDHRRREKLKAVLPYYRWGEAFTGPTIKKAHVRDWIWVVTGRSYDPDGDIVETKLDFVGDGKEWFTSKRRLTYIAHQYLKPGIYYPTVEVTDNDGLKARARTKIEILPVFCIQKFRVLTTDRKPIKGATIVIDGVKKLTTDEKGEASIELEKWVEHELSIETLCFQPFKHKFTACEGLVEVRLPRATCKQLFQIRDEKDIILKEWTAPKYKCKEYTTKITPPKAYECVECEKTYIACEKPVIFRVKSLLPKTCTQLFRVETEKGEPVGAATITVKGVGKKITDAEGKTSFTLTTGTRHLPHVHRNVSCLY